MLGAQTPSKMRISCEFLYSTPIRFIFGFTVEPNFGLLLVKLGRMVMLWRSENSIIFKKGLAYLIRRGRRLETPEFPELFEWKNLISNSVETQQVNILR